jgi:hypothetical protein
MADTWWRDQSVRDRVFDAIAAANEARSNARNDVEALEALSRSINQLFTCQNVVASSSTGSTEERPSDTRMFKRLLKACATSDKDWLVARESIAALAQCLTRRLQTTMSFDTAAWKRRRRKHSNKRSADTLICGEGGSSSRTDRRRRIVERFSRHSRQSSGRFGRIACTARSPSWALTAIA